MENTSQSKTNQQDENLVFLRNVKDDSFWLDMTPKLFSPEEMVKIHRARFIFTCVEDL